MHKAICGSRRRCGRGVCRNPVVYKNGRCRLHGGLSTGPVRPPAEGYSSKLARSAARDLARCKALGIKRAGGRKAGPLNITDRMLERAMVVARELGVWGLPERDGKLVWWLLKAEKDPAAVPRARDLLQAAERRVAKEFLRDMLGQLDYPDNSKS